MERAVRTQYNAPATSQEIGPHRQSDTPIENDSNSSTLFLPGEQITHSTANGAMTGVRYYTFDGITIAESTGTTGALYWLETNPQNTASLAVNAFTPSQVTRRIFTPYGTAVTGSNTWVDSRTFLGDMQQAATGLVDVGARDYDPNIGAFISVDPILETGDPRQMNGYAYSADDPINGSDPTGTMMQGSGTTCGYAWQCDKYGDGGQHDRDFTNYGNQLIGQTQTDSCRSGGRMTMCAVTRSNEYKDDGEFAGMLIAQANIAAVQRELAAEQKAAKQRATEQAENTSSGFCLFGHNSSGGCTGASILNTIFNHVYVQFQACLVVCVSWTIQGRKSWFTASGFNPFMGTMTPSSFLGVNVGA